MSGTDRPVKIGCVCLTCGGEAVSLYSDDNASVVWCTAGHVLIYDALREKGQRWKDVYNFRMHK